MELTKKDLLGLKAGKRSKQYIKAIDDAIALIRRKERDEAKAEKKAAYDAAARRQNAIAGRGPEAERIYDRLLLSESQSGGKGLSLEIVMGRELRDCDSAVFHDTFDNGGYIKTIEEGMDAFYAYISRYGSQAINGTVIALEVCDYCRTGVPAAFTDGAISLDYGGWEN
jgi:hypothetical protein